MEGIGGVGGGWNKGRKGEIGVIAAGDGRRRMLLLFRIMMAIECECGIPTLQSF